MKKILIIDDRNDNLISIKALLKSFIPDANVFTALSGQDGINIAENEQPDTILLDIIMPKMDGYETCRKLKEKQSTKHIPVIMLTAIKTDAESRIRGLNLGADAFLSKPVDPAELTAQINVMLRIKKAEDKLRLEKTNLEELVLERTKKLKESEEKFRAITESAMDAIFVKDLELKYTHINPAMEKFFGISASDLIGKTVVELFGEKEKDYIMELDTKVLNGEIVIEEREKIINEKTYLFHIIKAPLKNSDGKIVGLCGIARDITKRKYAEKQLEKERNRAERYLDLAGVMFITIDINENITLINKKGCEILGYKYSEIIGKNWFDNFIPELIRNEMKTTFHKMMSSNVEINEYFENQILTKNGDVKTVAWHNVRLQNKNGDITGILSSGEDITKRKMAEEENRNLIQMVEQSPAVVVLTDLSGNIKYVNSKFTSVTGYTFEEVKGQNPRILKSGEMSSEEYEELWETITKGEIWNGEFHNKKKNGELYWEDATIGPVKDVDGEITHYLAVKEDITKHKKMSQQLQQAQKLEAIGRFASGIAHDFNNILQVIIGYVYFAKQDLSEDDSRFKNIEEIRKATDKAAALSHQLLAFGSSQALEPRNININDLIKGLLKMIRRIICENINLEFIGEQNINSIYADPSQMEQIIMNLCVNAKDAMMWGGDLIIKTENVLIGDEYCRKYPWGKEGKYVLLTVTDTGLGMDKTTVDKVFEPFFTTKKENDGTGLGLATVFSIVKQHDGMVNVFSEEGKGTTFKIYLPIVEKKCDMVETKSEYSMQGGNEAILIAEDDEAIRNLATRILEDVGYNVIVAADGNEAVALFKQNSERISLLFLDMIMPNMGGLSAFKCIEKINPDIHVLFCSGYSSKTFWKGFTSMKNAKKICKPYSRNSLLKLVREILDSK